MSIEGLTALIAFLSLVVTIVGFILHGMTQNMKAIWNEHNAFKDKVHDTYATKEYVKDQSSAKYDLLVENINALAREVKEVKEDVESMEAQVRGINELSPQLLLTLHQIRERLEHDRV